MASSIADSSAVLFVGLSAPKYPGILLDVTTDPNPENILFSRSIGLHNSMYAYVTDLVFDACSGVNMQFM